MIDRGYMRSVNFTEKKGKYVSDEVDDVLRVVDEGINELHDEKDRLETENSQLKQIIADMEQKNLKLNNDAKSMAKDDGRAEMFAKEVVALKQKVKELGLDLEAKTKKLKEYNDGDYEVSKLMRSAQIYAEEQKKAISEEKEALEKEIHEQRNRLFSDLETEKNQLVKEINFRKQEMLTNMKELEDAKSDFFSQTYKELDSIMNGIKKFQTEVDVYKTKAVKHAAKQEPEIIKAKLEELKTDTKTEVKPVSEHVPENKNEFKWDVSSLRK